MEPNWMFYRLLLIARVKLCVLVQGTSHPKSPQTHRSVEFCGGYG